MDPSIQVHYPRDPLRTFVKCYISTQFSGEERKIWIPADLRNQLFIIREGQAFIHSSNQTYEQPAISIRGSFTQPLEVSFAGPRIDAFVIEFTEIGLGSLLLDKVSSVTNSFSDMQKVCPESIAEFFNDHRHQPDNRLIKHFENFVSKQALNHKAQVVEESLSHIKQTRANIRVADLAKRVNSHPKTLGRYFLSYTGLNVRDFLQLYRFHVTCKGALVNGRTDNSPYFDQSHLIREFIKYSGVSPSQVQQIDNSWLKFILEKDLF